MAALQRPLRAAPVAGAQSPPLPIRNPGGAGKQSVQNSKSSLAGLTMGAIGVVFGDIGTSVLYTV